jgi:hypothetical protein
VRDYDPNQPRAASAPGHSGGEFASYGAGVEAVTSAEPPSAKLDPRVTDVGGDVWNRTTAVRLEREYQSAKPALDKIINDLVGKSVEPQHPDDEDVDQSYVPGEWDMMSPEDQEAVQQAWMESTHTEFFDSEVNNWIESGQQLDDSKNKTAFEYENKGLQDWVKDVFDEVRGDHRIPYTDDQLHKAISVTFESNHGDGSDDPMVEFDDTKLQEPQWGHDPSAELPLGLKPIDPSSALTQDMRDALEKSLTKAFNKEADNNAYKIDPPDYLNDSIEEFQDEVWGQKNDHEKFDWAQHNWSGFPADDQGQPATVTTLDRLPSKWDPLEEGGSDKDYRLTAIAARLLSRQRAADLMVQRGVFEDHDQAMRAATRFDNSVWTAWKSSSSSREGTILQAATAAELGGRARGNFKPTPDMVENANKTYDLSGGWEGVKAYVRGKWETTQYMLDKADRPTLDLYRAVKIEGAKGKETSVRSPTEFSKEYTKLDDINLVRNGAQSTSTDANISNDWDGSSGRVVLRLQAPRTAALSVPVYGQNVYNEHEVVVAGTAWKKWDAWLGKAPRFSAVKMHDRSRSV